MISVYFEVDKEKTTMLPARSVKVIVAAHRILTELGFEKVEPQLYEIEEDNPGILIPIIRNFRSENLLECLKALVVKFPDGHMENALASYYKVKERNDKYEDEWEAIRKRHDRMKAGLE